MPLTFDYLWRKIAIVYKEGDLLFQVVENRRPFLREIKYGSLSLIHISKTPKFHCRFE